MFYRTLRRVALDRGRRLETDAVHLHDVEKRGEEAATPFIAVGGVILFLLPIFLFLLGVAFAAYYLAR